jgi:hypothetical protein
LATVIDDRSDAVAGDRLEHRGKAIADLDRISPRDGGVIELGNERS